MKRRMILAAGLMLAGTLQAAENPGFYAGAGVGQLEVTDEDFGLSFKGDDTAFRVFGGYQFNRHFAVEGAYVDGGHVTDTVAGLLASIDVTGFQGSLVGMVPFGEHVSGFAKAGVLFYDSTITVTDGFDVESIDGSGNEFAWGAGLAFKIGQKGRADLAYEGAEAGTTDYRLISLSFSWMFN